MILVLAGEASLAVLFFMLGWWLRGKIEQLNRPRS